MLYYLVEFGWIGDIVAMVRYDRPMREKLHIDMLPISRGGIDKTILISIVALHHYKIIGHKPCGICGVH
jgi:hypothetical protein